MQKKLQFLIFVVSQKHIFSNKKLVNAINEAITTLTDNYKKIIKQQCT